jgi:ADP-dependent NAD(P)H-hydrate dehydratase / NAD(P)H-hydrate epimerase
MIQQISRSFQSRRRLCDRSAGAREGAGFLIVGCGFHQDWRRSSMAAHSPPSELLTTTEMAMADRLTIEAGTPGIVLMERAGGAVARAAAHRMTTRGCARGRIAIFCGPGNNGGDGFVAARHLVAEGFDIDLALLGARADLRGDAAWAAESWTGPVVALDAVALEEVDLAIDALFGAGLTRAVEGEAKDAIQRMNEWTLRTGKPIVSVDIPSGIDGSTGEARGDAVKAAYTVTFFRLKPGHILLPGRVHCGEIECADIGIPDDVLARIAPQNAINVPAVWAACFPRLRIEGHKYSRGHALVLSGGRAHTGAARLAARGALRAGAGLVTVATPSEALPIHAAALTAIMTTICEGPEDLAQILADRRKNAVVIGPGLGVGKATRDLVFAALARHDAGTQSPRGIVLDADALTSFAGEPSHLAEAIAASDCSVVLTPHDGEFARLFATKEGESRDHPATELLVSGSKLKRACGAAALMQATIVLKGADSVVADQHGRTTIARNAPPWLATAGSGDVLAGFIAALLAQGMPAFEAASAAVYLHAAAAQHFGPGLISEDIPENLPPVLRQILATIGP